MASKSTTLAIKIVGDASNGIRALDETESRTGRFLKGMGTAAVIGAGAAVAAIGSIGVAAFKAASDLEQSTGAVTSVFGDWAIDIEQEAAKAANAVGLSKNAYQELASVTGAQLKNFGLSNGEAVDGTKMLIATGADLAATFGGPTSDAVSALGSLLRGEADPIERYGISIKQADIDARLASTGMDKLTGAAANQARAQAILGMVTEQSGGALGAFAREGDTAAGASARLSAWFENTKATMGEKLLPMFVTAVEFFQTSVAPAIDNLTRAGGPLQVFLENVGEVIRTQVVPMAQQMWTYFQSNLMPIINDVAGVIQRNFVPAFSRIVEVVRTYVIPIMQNTLGPIMEGVRSAFNSVAGAVEDNRDKFQKIYENVQPLLAFLRDKVAPVVGGVLKTAFDQAGKVIGFLVDKIAWVLEKGSAVINIVGGLFGSGTPASEAAGYGAGSTMFGAARTASPLQRAASLGSLVGGTAPAAGQGLAATVININVTGALDPDAVAEQISGLLARRARRTGGAVALAFG